MLHQSIPSSLEVKASLQLLHSSTRSYRNNDDVEDRDDDSPESFISLGFEFVDVMFSFLNRGNRTYRPLAVLPDHVGSVSSVALCGEFILSGSQGKDIIVWQQPDLRMLTKFGQGEGSVKAVTAVGNKVFTAHQDNMIRVWKVSRRCNDLFKLVDTLPTMKDCYVGKFIRRHHKKLWMEHSDTISCLAVSISNGLLYSGSWDRTLKVWRISDLKCMESIKAHDDAINGLVSCKGLVYSASADGKIKAWGKGEEGNNDSLHYLRGVLEGHTGVSVNSVAVSDDGKWVYGGGSDGFLMGWEGTQEFVRWKLVSDRKAHEMSILCMCMVGDFLCTGSADQSIGIWRRRSLGEIIMVGCIRGHEGPVKCLQASSFSVGEGFLLYSGSLDKSLRVWWVPKNSCMEQGDSDSSVGNTEERSSLW